MGTEGLVFCFKYVLKYFYSGLCLATLISDKAKIKKPAHQLQHMNSVRATTGHICHHH